MGLNEETAALRRLVAFEPEEKILHRFMGTVSGTSQGLQSREGIVFLTTLRVGVSAAGGLFSEDAVEWAGFEMILDASVVPAGAETTALRIRLTDKSAFQFSSSNTDKHSLAKQITQAANRVDRADLAAYYQAARQAMEQDLDVAGVQARAILQRHPTAVRAHMILCVVHERQRLWDKAVADLNAALAAGAEPVVDLLEELAYCHVQLERFDDAIEAATAVIDSAPTARAYAIRSEARKGKSDKRGALDDLKRGADLDPTDMDVWFHLGSAALEEGEQATYLRVLATFERCGDGRRAALLRCGILGVESRHAEALAAAVALVESAPDAYVVMRSLLISASELAREEAIAYLPILDAHWQGQLEYEFYVAALYLATRHAREGATRWGKVSATLSTELAKLPLVHLLLGCLSSSAYVEGGEFVLAHEAAEQCALSIGLAQLDSHERQSWSVLCALHGKALLELERFEAAFPLLREAEACPDLGIPWLVEEIPVLMDRTHAGLARSGVVTTASVRPTAHVNPYQFLSTLADALEASGRLQELAIRVRRDCTRFDEPPLIAVMGEYSVGKSTFINALLRRELLPTGEGVTTGTITVLQYGDEERMRAVRKDGSVEEYSGLTSVDQFVRETGGANSQVVVDHVDVFLKSEVLKRIRIVDTPGLNAPFPEHKQITERYLAESDAILFLFSVEAAGKVGERTFLDKLQQHSRKAVAVVNQIDLVSASDAREALDGVALDFPGLFVQTLGVSAKRALGGHLSNTPDLVAKSAMPALEKFLEDNLLASARQVKADAAIEKSREVLRDVAIARAGFDAGLEKLATSVKEQREAMIRWVNSGLQIEMQTGYGRLRGELDAQMRATAEAIAARSTARESASFAAMEPLARALHGGSVAGYDSLFQTSAAAYDVRTSELLEVIEAMDTPEWSDVIAGGVLQLRLRVESWRKDLSDYLEQVSAYVDGFVSARGVALALNQDLTKGNRDRPDAILAVLRPKMAFMHERAEGEAGRWQRELAASFRDELTSFERKLREEASAIREHSFRRVERLAAML